MLCLSGSLQSDLAQLKRGNDVKQTQDVQADHAAKDSILDKKDSQQNGRAAVQVAHRL